MYSLVTSQRTGMRCMTSRIPTTTPGLLASLANKSSGKNRFSALDEKDEEKQEDSRDDILIDESLAQVCDVKIQTKSEIMDNKSRAKDMKKQRRKDLKWEKRVNRDDENASIEFEIRRHHHNVGIILNMEETYEDNDHDEDEEDKVPVSNSKIRPHHA